MTAKLHMSPDVSYMLGISTLGKDQPSISVSSKNDELVERFIRIAMNSLKIDSQKIMFNEKDGIKSALFYNSKVKRLMKDAMEDRERIFKYLNEYSASYFAGIYDTRGGVDKKGIWLRVHDLVDVIVLERLGFRVSGKNISRVRNQNEKFAAFIRPYSTTLKKI